MRVDVAYSPAASADYRRQARKIRASFAAQPLLRHHALTSLATRHDANHHLHLRGRMVQTAARTMPPARYLPAEAGNATSAVEARFADHSADRLRTGVFTFSDRARLLERGERLGISRFRANLILALEQHRLNPVRSTIAPSAPRLKSWLPTLLAIVTVEAIIVGLFVWACAV